VKRGSPEPLINDIVLCVEMGWTKQQLEVQPAQFVEKLQIYLNTVKDNQERERRRIEEDIKRLQQG